MIYVALFWSFLKIGLFGFGGGLAIISLIEHEVINRGWLSEQEFVDIVAISQVTPGPIGMNCATYVGYSATGSVWGSLLASSAIVLPSLVIMIGLCRLYFAAKQRFERSPYYQNTLRMLRIVVIGLIAAAAAALVTPTTFIDLLSIVIFTITVLLLLLPEWTDKRPISPVLKKTIRVCSHPIYLLIAAGVVGYLIYG